MIKIKFQTRNLKTGEILNDEASVFSLETARKELEGIIEGFNFVEKQRYGDEAQLRELVAVDTDQEGQLQHDWDKKNIVGVEDARGVYDLWQCSNCGLKREVRSLDAVPSGGDCFPERTCKYCNRVFASAKNLQRHMERSHE